MISPNLSWIVRKNPESYREHGAGIFTGEAAKGRQDKNFIKKHQPLSEPAFADQVSSDAYPEAYRRWAD